MQLFHQLILFCRSLSSGCTEVYKIIIYLLSLHLFSRIKKEANETDILKEVQTSITMDSKTTNYRFKTCLVTISAVNLIFLVCFTYFGAFDLYPLTSMSDVRLTMSMIILINIIFFVNIVRLLFAIKNRKIRNIKCCVEYFIVLFVLNIIPMITKKAEESDKCSYDEYTQQCYFNLKEDNGKNSVYSFISFHSKYIYVMLVLEIYFAYLYYNYELKCPQQNVSPTHPLRWDPFAPTKLSQTASAHMDTNLFGKITVRKSSQPAGQNATSQLDQNATEPHIIRCTVQPPVKM